MNITIEFGGFYQGIHAEYIENLIESELEYQDFKVPEDSFNYSDIYQQYIIKYLKYVFKCILGYESIKLTFKSKDIYLDSPREYNFQTDVIIWKSVSKTNIKKLQRLFRILLEEEDFRNYITHKTTSRDGYIPFYTYKEVIDYKTNPEVSFGLALSYWCMVANDNIYPDFFENLELNLYC